MLKRPGLIDLLGVIFLLVTVFLRGNLAGDPGLGWHLKTGEWIVTHGNVPTEDPFLLSDSPRPWIAEQWLGDVVLWGVQSTFGWAGLHLFVALVVLSAFFVVLAPVVRKVAPEPLPAFLALFAGASIASIQWFIRPVIFSFLFFAIVYALLVRRENLRSLFWALPPIFVLWANLHPGFIHGLLLLVIFTVSRIRDRRTFVRSLALFALCVLVTGVTPYGFQSYGNIFYLSGSEYFLNLNSEWLSPVFQKALFQPFAVALLIVVGLSALPTDEKRRPSFFEITTFSCFLILALLQRRNIPYCGVALVLPLARMLQGRGKFFSRKSSGSITVFRYSALLGVALAVIVGFTHSIPGRPLADFAIRDPFPGLDEKINGDPRVFHSPNIGGALAYFHSPKLRPFIDDRNQLIPVKEYEDFFQIEGGKPGWRETVSRYKFDYLLIESMAPLRRLLEISGDWKEVSATDERVLYQALRSNTP